MSCKKISDVGGDLKTTMKQTISGQSNPGLASIIAKDQADSSPPNAVRGVRAGHAPAGLRRELAPSGSLRCRTFSLMLSNMISVFLVYAIKY